MIIATLFQMIRFLNELRKYFCKKNQASVTSETHNWKLTMDMTPARNMSSYDEAPTGWKI